MARNTTARSNIQARINERLGDPAVIDALVSDALAAEIFVDAECPDCGAKKLKVKAPDIKKRVDTLIALLEQGEGRPEQRAPGALQIVVQRPAFSKPE